MSDFALTPTNTLASATFDTLRMDAIEDPLINVNKLATMDFEESYFLAAIKFINESNNEFTQSKIKLYQSISEATSDMVVLESFSDFFTSVKNIIDKFLKFIKSLFERFINALMSLVSSDKYLNKNKKKLDEFKQTDEFTMRGYKYTFQHNIPDPNTGLEFSQNLLSGLYSSNNTGLTVDDVKTAIASMDLDEVYDSFRATVIGREGEKISVSDFAEELFRVFRNDEMDTEELEIDASYVRQAKARYFDYSKTKTAVERQQKDIERSYKEIEKQVKEFSTSNGKMTAAAFVGKLPDASGNQINSKHQLDGGYLSAEFMTQVDIYIKNKIDQIQEYSNIHAIAFSAKLDALKECYKQDKATLYTALSKILRTEAARKEAGLIL